MLSLICIYNRKILLRLHYEYHTVIFRVYFNRYPATVTIPLIYQWRTHDQYTSVKPASCPLMLADHFPKIRIPMCYRRNTCSIILVHHPFRYSKYSSFSEARNIPTDSLRQTHSLRRTTYTYVLRLNVIHCNAAYFKALGCGIAPA